MVKVDSFKSIEKKCITALFCCLSLVSCGHKDRQDVIVAGEDYFSIKENQIDSIFDLGHIEKAIKPEISDESLFDFAVRIRMDNDGDIFILDEFPEQSLLRFDQEGKFINKYGGTGQGPGEYHFIVGFDFDSMGNIYLLTFNKLIKYKKTGEILDECKINLRGNGIEIIGEELLVYVLQDRTKGLENNAAVYIFNQQLQKINEIGIYDRNLMQYSFLPPISLTGSSKELYFVDAYDLVFSKYDIEKKALIRFLFSNRNNRLENVWSKFRLTEDDRTEIKLKLHRFNYILYYIDHLFVDEVNRESDIYKFWLIDLRKRIIEKYSYFKLINNPNDPQDHLNFDYIAGSYSNGLILVIDDNERFNKYKNQIKELQNIEFTFNDNPLVVFFNLNN